MAAIVREMWSKSALSGFDSVIFVTTGTHYLQFDRLVRAADELCAVNREKVIIQCGCSNYVPKYAEHFRWTTYLDMVSLTREARVVISQASAGAIIVALKHGKPLILVPRFKRFGENHDDHQLQLARSLAAEGCVVIVENPSGPLLSDSVGKVVRYINPQIRKANRLQLSLEQKLLEWSKSSAPE